MCIQCECLIFNDCFCDLQHHKMYVIHPDRSSAYGLSGIRDEKREPGSGQGSG